MALTACSKNINYAPAVCSIISGGISNLYVADATLFDFTQAAPIASVTQPYTAITYLGAGTPAPGGGIGLFPIQFETMSAEYDFDMKNENGVSPAYTHKCMFNVPRVNMLASQWGMLINQQGYCCGILIIMITNANDILIMGEGSVNAAPLTPKFSTYQEGTKGGTGKKAADKNTVGVTLTSIEYFRPLIQYTGTVASITALSN